MACYLTKDIMLLYTRSYLLVKLTNDDPTVDPHDSSNIDDDVLNEIMESSCYDVSLYLRGIYYDGEPGDTPTKEIVSLAARLCKCNLWGRTGQEPTQITEERTRIYEHLHELASKSSDKLRDQTWKSKVSDSNRQ